MDATSILFKLINDYLGPIMGAAGYHISHLGTIETNSGSKLMYQNPKYIPGTNDPQIPQVLIPIIPITDADYLNIKLTPDYDLFSPFTYFKHAAYILIKLKDVLIPYCISQERQDSCEDEESLSTLGDYLQVYNKTDDKGMYEVGIVNTEDPQNPKTCISYSSEELVKSVWGCCVLIYLNYCNSSKTIPTQFRNIDRSWKHIQKMMGEWDKARKGIVQINNLSKESDYSNPNDIDLSVAQHDNGLDAGDYVCRNYSNSGYYLETNDGEDINDTVLQNYMTSLFSPDSLEPYIEPEPEVIPTEERRVNPVVETVTVTSPIQEEVIRINDEQSSINMKEEMQKEAEIEEESHKSIFSVKQTTSPETNPNLGMQMNNFGFGMNPMMMGMNMGMGAIGNLPPQSMDDACLGTFIDPYSAYR
jgi:hypothetical protein